MDDLGQHNDAESLMADLRSRHPGFREAVLADTVVTAQHRGERHDFRSKGDALLAAMKGQVFESPRGKVFIDAQTRDIVQDVYLRKVERVNGQLYNVEFDVIKDVKDPGKTK